MLDVSSGPACALMTSRSQSDVAFQPLGMLSRPRASA